MSKHTPGPWEESGLTVYDTCMDVVASVHSAADARLIAAAPDMLEALKVTMQHGRIDDSEARMNLVAAAVAKAEGKE